MTGYNNVAMSSRSQSRSTRHQRSTSAIVSKISRGRTTQALKHDHTQFVCNALWVWKPMQIHQGRCNVIKALQAKNQTSSRKSQSNPSISQAARWHFSPRWMILECWLTANFQWGNTCNGYADHLFTSFASSASYEVPFQWRHVQPWFTRSSQVGLTTVTAYFLESTKNCWTGSNRFFGLQRASSCESGNSIRSPKISGTLCIGFPFARELNSNSASSLSSVCTAMPRPVWSNRYHWWRSIRLSKRTGPPPAVTLWCLGQEQLEWNQEVFMSPVQSFGTRFRSKFEPMNKLWRRSRLN